MRKLLLATVIALVAPVAFTQYKVDTAKAGTHPTLPSSNSGALQITTPSQTEKTLASAPRISRDEARKLVKAGKAVYIDVRSTATYEAGHLPGALSFPGSQLLNRLKDLPPGKKLITYCACVEEHTAAVAVLNLHAHRLDNAAALVGGWNDWKAAGLPMEFGPQVVARKQP
jgi:rhodanese-related sulfurtransferase